MREVVPYLWTVVRVRTAIADRGFPDRVLPEREVLELPRNEGDCRPRQRAFPGVQVSAAGWRAWIRMFGRGPVPGVWRCGYRLNQSSRCRTLCPSWADRAGNGLLCLSLSPFPVRSFFYNTPFCTQQVCFLQLRGNSHGGCPCRGSASGLPAGMQGPVCGTARSGCRIGAPGGRLPRESGLPFPKHRLPVPRWLPRVW